MSKHWNKKLVNALNIKPIFISDYDKYGYYSVHTFRNAIRKIRLYRENIHSIKFETGYSNTQKDYVFFTKDTKDRAFDMTIKKISPKLERNVFNNIIKMFERKAL